MTGLKIVCICHSISWPGGLDLFARTVWDSVCSCALPELFGIMYAAVHLASPQCRFFVCIGLNVIDFLLPTQGQCCAF